MPKDFRQRGSLTDLEPTVVGSSPAAFDQARTSVDHDDGQGVARDVRIDGKQSLDRDSSATAVEVPSPHRHVPEKLGQAVGHLVAERYLIDSVIGEGGMGSVCKARHMQLGKEFALKQMHAALSGDERLRANFYREARLASRLSHPNIVSVIDFGEDETIGVFMVMELVEGESLAKRLHMKGRFPLHTGLEIVAQIADALHYIHGEGIVHGDIKPENILLSRAKARGRRWHATLLDFGLARRAESGGQRAKYVEGTPEYLAPEQARGHRATASSDVYSLGVLAYHVLAGQLPFDGTAAELQMAHAEQEPPALSKHVDIDERVEALIMKALEKSPEDRQRDVAAFLYELKTVIEMLGIAKTRRLATRMKTVEASTEESPRLLRRAFDQAPIALAVVNSDGSILEANAQFAHFFGSRSVAEVCKRSVLDPRFVRIHVHLPDDLKEVLQTRKPTSRTLTVVYREQETMQLLAELSALEEEVGMALLSILPLPSGSTDPQ